MDVALSSATGSIGFGATKNQWIAEKLHGAPQTWRLIRKILFAAGFGVECISSSPNAA
jgi:hypothetical protein